MTNVGKKEFQPNDVFMREDLLSTLGSALRPTPLCWYCKTPLFDDEDTTSSANGNMHLGCADEFKKEREAES